MPLQFANLWSSHPLNLTTPENFPCKDKNGNPAFSNQCAIKMSIALNGAGVNMKACNKVKCWYGHGIHVIRAQELADWLSANVSTPKKFIKKKKTANAAFQTDVLKEIAGKNGIVFCMNFWGDGMQGDHIDVWNGSQMSGLNDHLDYYARSQQVWFWEILV